MLQSHKHKQEKTETQSFTNINIPAFHHLKWRKAVDNSSKERASLSKPDTQELNSETHQNIGLVLVQAANHFQFML